MKSALKQFFKASLLSLASLTSLATLATLALYLACANIPTDKMPDPEIPPIDTLIVADTTVFGDTLVFCVTTLIDSIPASVTCVTKVLGDIEIPYMLSRVDDVLNNYCLYPITFTAFPPFGDLEYISEIYLDLDVAEDGLPRSSVLLLPPAYSAVFSYADTGVHSLRMRVVMRLGDFVLEEAFEVRTAVRFEVSPVSISVSDTGSFHVFRAGGYRPRDVYWVWDLTSIGGGVIKVLEDTVSVFVRGEHDSRVVLYQEDGGGRRTPGVDVGFRSVIGTMYNVVVDVGGVGGVDILPRRDFLVPYNGEVSVGVRALVNTRIVGVSVNGVPLYVFGDSLVRDTSVTVSGIRADVRILVVVAGIDTVLPLVELVWPYDRHLTPWVVCEYGVLVYRLNKRMAGGYVRWTSLYTTTTYQHADSVMAVRFPEDLRVDAHEVAGWQYGAPGEYLAEGLHKYSHYVSPRAGRRFTRDVSGAYRVDMWFADTLGNVSDTLKYTVDFSERAENMGWHRACEDERRALQLLE